jgi:2-methylcitrate dehydratase PrpD
VFAYTLVKGKLDLEYSSDEALANDRIREQVKKVTISLDRKATDGVTVHLRFKDGTELSETVVEAKGHPTRPLSEADMFERFQMCLEFGRPGASAEGIRSLWDALVELPAADDCLDAVRLIHTGRTGK